MIVNEIGDVVADVKDEPDRGESRDAVKINLHEVSNDVSIEKSHWPMTTVLTLILESNSVQVRSPPNFMLQRST